MRTLKKQCLWKWAILLLLLVIIGTVSFLTGRYVSDSSYKEEQALNVQLNRSDLEGLSEIEGTIYVTGHQSPDSDTVSSSIAYAALLNALGYDARPVVLGDINNETKYILDTGEIDAPMLLDDASGCNMILVDHSEYTQSATGLKDANVIAIIDHHGDGSVTTENQLVYDARPLGSTATIIWIRYRNYGIEIDRKVAYAMVGAILSDTKNLRSNTTTFADREALKILAPLAGIDDTDAFYQEMYKVSISYEGKSDTEIFYSDYKEYDSDGRKFAIGCINAYDEDAANDLIDRMSNVIQSADISNGIDLCFAQINILHDDISVTYLVPSNETGAEILKTAFKDDAVYDGTSYRFEPSISRKQMLVPKITEVLKSYPQE